MMGYSWPGNIRELENVLARANILCEENEIDPEFISLGPEIMEIPAPPPDNFSPTYHDAIEHFSKALLLDALKKTGWNQTKAAALLHLQRTYFTKLLKQKKIPTKLSALDISA